MLKVERFRCAFVGQVWDLDDVVVLILGRGADGHSMRCVTLDAGDDRFIAGEVADWSCFWLSDERATRLS